MLPLSLAGFQLDQFAGFRLLGGRDSLGRAPEVHIGGVVHAGDGAARRATFFGDELPADMLDRIVRQRNRRIAALLRTVMHQAILANVQVPGAGPAFPLVLTAMSDVVLKEIETGV